MAATVVLDQQNRLGTIPTSSLPVPAGASLVHLASTISDADALDATKGCILYLNISWDGINYEPFESSQWTGGNRDKNGNPAGPSIGRSIPTDANGNPPQRVMATLDTIGNVLNMGLTLAFE